MSKPLLKSRMIIDGNRLLGSLIYFRDTQGRESLKFSFKTKVGGMELWQEKIGDDKREPLEDIWEEGVSLDISYKFDDSTLEIKRQEPGLEPHSRFIPVPNPMKAYLFAIRIKNWQTALPEVKIDSNALLLSLSGQHNQAYLIFSFCGENGRPFVDDTYKDGNGKMVSAPLPKEFPFNQICIGISDDSKNSEKYDLTLKIPNEFGGQ